MIIANVQNCLMGGKALKNTITKRIDLDSYLRIKQQITETLESQGYTIGEIKPIPGKDSFGDLDLLYIAKSNQDISQVIKELFEPNEIPVIRGGWIDRNNNLYNDDIDNKGLKSVNIFKNGTVDAKNRPTK